MHSTVENLYSTKIVVIFIYLALKGEQRRKGVFSSLVILGNTVICVFLILCPLPQSICHPYSVQHLKYLTWVGTGPG